LALRSHSSSSNGKQCSSELPGCREHAEGSLLWDVFYAPDMGLQPVAQMCMESAARQTTFNLQLASQLDHQDYLTIKTLDFRFRCHYMSSVTCQEHDVIHRQHEATC